MLIHRTTHTDLLTTAVILVASMVLAGCVSTQRLGDFELENRSLAIMAAVPDHPIVFHELLAARGVRPYDPRGRHATGIEQSEAYRARRLEEQLRSVTEHLDVAGLLARETGRQSAEVLGMQIVDDPETADYVLDVRVYDYGLLMFSRHERALFFLDGEILLVSNETGDIVWKQSFDDVTASSHAIGPTQFSYIEHDELAGRLTTFVEFAADRFIRRLDRAWRRV